MPKALLRSPRPQPLAGLIWDIKKYAIHDGPGIRTTVFFKGCPLHCDWCCNPEAQNAKPEILYLKERCLRCNRCLEICPTRGIALDQRGEKRISRSRCDACGLCTIHCPNGALTIIGKWMTASEVLKVTLRDAAFYERSGGGLTLTGGEPGFQADFVGELLRRYKREEHGGHAAIETCGVVSWPKLRRLLEFTDLVLYDIKHMDSNKHLSATGADNRRILQNARRIAESGVHLIIRFPLIPGFNDSEENIRQTAAFAQSLPGVEELDLLPYHRLGEPKYPRLGRTYGLPGLSAIHPERLKEIRSLIEEYGLRVQVGG